MSEEALTFKASLFDDAAVEVVQRYGPGGPGAEGSVMHGRLRIGDPAFTAFDSPKVHAFDFTPSLALFVSCDEVRRPAALRAYEVALENADGVETPTDPPRSRSTDGSKAASSGSGRCTPFSTR